MNFGPQTPELFILLPEFTLITAIGMVLVLECFGGDGTKKPLAWLSILALSIAGFQIWINREGYFEVLWNMFLIDIWSSVLNIIFIIGSILSVLISIPYLEQQKLNYGKYCALILVSTLGMMLMVSSNHLFIIILGLEILSISTHALCVFTEKDPLSMELRLKSFFPGAFGTGFLLFGISLVYGSTGTTDLVEIHNRISTLAFSEKVSFLGILLIICGFSIKLAIAPFHMWALDVYQGAPTPATAFLSAGPKLAGFGALGKILITGFISLDVLWNSLITGLAGITVVVGTLLMITQTKVKRMLAYSAITHSGYLLVALVAFDTGGIRAMVFNFLVFTFMFIGAFAIVMVFEGGKEEIEFADFSGLGIKFPVLGISLLIFMLSMAGIPLTGGFWGKLFIFYSALEGKYTWLGMICMLSSVVSAFIYLKLVVYLFMEESQQNDLDGNRDSIAINVAVITSAGGLIALGLYPNWFLQLSFRVYRSLIAYQ